MKTKNDLELLREFVRDQSQEAFTALVQQHLNLVYCAALRQVRSPQLAEDVAQSVFTDLARTAARLKPGTILSAWLYEVTRRTAINVVRGEARRQLREQIALQMNVMNATAEDWTQIEPLLDEAMHALDETDRAAVLLRFFENKSLREVGQSLGTTDDTARKRVNRAVERLREFFAQRGVSVGVSGLVVVISANAVQAAPIGLAGAISTAVVLTGTVVHTSIAAATTKAIAMTTLQKALVTTVIAATVTTAIYEARQAAIWRDRSQKLHEQTGAQIQQLTGERDEAMRQLRVLGAETNRAGNGAELLRLRGEMARLRALESDLANLREESARNQAEARKAKADLAAAEEVAHEFLVRRITSIDALKQVGHQLRQLAAANNLGAAFTADGKLNPNLIAGTHPNFDMQNVELSLSDPAQLPKLLQEAPETIVARTVEPVATPDERWMRFYIQADGSVQNYSTPLSNQVFSGNWQLEYLKQ